MPMPATSKMGATASLVDRDDVLDCSADAKGDVVAAHSRCQPTSQAVDWSAAMVSRGYAVGLRLLLLDENRHSFRHKTRPQT